MKKIKRITAAVLAAMLLALSLFSAYAEPADQNGDLFRKFGG